MTKDKLLEMLNMLLLTLAFAIITLRQFTLARSRDRFVEGVEGETLAISCPVGAYLNPRWIDPKQSIISSNGVYSIESENNEYTLTITALNRFRDDGKFTCERGPARNTSFNVRVLAKIKEVTIIGKSTDNGEINISNGKHVNLTCSVIGNPIPEPTFKWMVDGKGVFKGQYFTFNVDRTAAGKTVTCGASNIYLNGTVLSSKTGRAVINVLYLDGPDVTYRIIAAFEDDTATLRCSGEGKPPPSYQWRRSGSLEVISTFANYNIENVQRSSAGNYTCTVYNSEGSYQTIIFLQVKKIDNSTDTSDTKKKLYVILGPVVAVCVLIIVVVIGLLLCIRCKRAAEPDKSPNKVTLPESATGNVSGQNGVAESSYENTPPVTGPYMEDDAIYEEIPMENNSYERLNALQGNQITDGAYVTMTAEATPSGKQDESTSGKLSVEKISKEKPIKTKLKDTKYYDNNSSEYDEGYEYVSSKRPGSNGLTS